MTFIRTLTEGEISRKNKYKNTPYDDFIAKKPLAIESFSDVEVSIVSPTTFNDVECLIEELKNCHGLVVDLKKAQTKDQQRMLDFMSGAIFALDGRIERLKEKIFVMTPKGVAIKSKQNTQKTNKKKG